MDKINGASIDIVADNIAKLKKIFPEVFCEDKVDFERLQEVLGNYIEDKEERYRFEWNGKSKAIRISQTPSTGTLRPCKEESKDWDTTQNLYIEGDNLEVLKLLQKSYQNKVKMIYIDPPYNTGNDFVYKDDYKDNLRNYLAITGQLDDEGRKTTTNSESGGRFHTEWLNMMYPRLRLAKNLLKDNGVIFISIDDTEVANLRKICDEIFGEENFISNLIWQKKFARQNDAMYFSTMHDHILCYAKAKKQSKNDKEGFNINLLPRTDEDNKDYKNLDNDERGPWNSVILTAASGTEKLRYKLVSPTGVEHYPSEGRYWSYSQENMKKLIEDNRIWFGKDGNNVPRLKTFLSEVQSGITPNSIWFHEEVGHTQGAKQSLKKLFDGASTFDTPKPIELIERIINISTDEDDIILDFFGGSSTTAHAIINYNNNNNSNRKFIIVQLPEQLDSKSDAYKAGFRDISEIGKERIRKAINKIQNDGLKNKSLDLGFKVFKLDSSNIKKWNPDYDELEQSFDDILENFVPNRTEEDVVYEIMLKYGIDLTYPVEERVINDKKVFSIGFGALIICLDDNISLDVVNGIVELKQELEPEICRVVFKDNGFATDSVKTNAIQILKRNNIKEVMSI